MSIYNTIKLCKFILYSCVTTELLYFVDNVFEFIYYSDMTYPLLCSSLISVSLNSTFGCKN